MIEIGEFQFVEKDDVNVANRDLKNSRKSSRVLSRNNKN